MLKITKASVAQLARALASHVRGQGLNPSSPPRRRGIYIRGGFIFAGRRLARAEAAQVRGLDHSERYVGRALLLAGRNPPVLTVNPGAAAFAAPACTLWVTAFKPSQIYDAFIVWFYGCCRRCMT